MANAFTNAGFSGFVLVDFSLNPDVSNLNLLYSNKGTSATSPGAAITGDAGTVVMEEQTKDLAALHPSPYNRWKSKFSADLFRANFHNVPFSGGGSPAYLELDKLSDGRYRATVGTLFEYQEL